MPGSEKTVVVTGGAGRIGKAIAARLAKDGWRVVVTSSRRGAGADAVADLSVDGGADRLFAAVLEITGGKAPYALVNNAGLFSGPGAAIENVNLIAPVRLTELMSDREGTGAVVNILDRDFPANCRASSKDFASAYARSKSLLARRTLEDARKYLGVLRVNGVAPGPVFPPPCGGVKASYAPFGRPTAEQVADAVAYLLSAPTVSAAIIPVG